MSMAEKKKTVKKRVLGKPKKEPKVSGKAEEKPAEKGIKAKTRAEGKVKTEVEKVKRKKKTEEKKEEKPAAEEAKTEKPKEEQPEARKPLPVPEAIKQAKKLSKKRNFTQSVDIAVNFKNLDFKKPENRFTIELQLPEGRGKPQKIAFIADTLEKQVKEHVDLVIPKKDIEKLGKDKKQLKKIARDYDFFLAEVGVMPLIGKTLGVVLGPMGKMPKPVPPNIKPEPLIEAAKRSVRVSVKGPVVHVPIGAEDMPDEKLSRNLESVYNTIREKLPKGKNNIRSVYLKLTMGSSVKLDIR
jgi:large subunit ribosomal protein L1